MPSLLASDNHKEQDEPATEVHKADVSKGNEEEEFISDDYKSSDVETGDRCSCVW